MLFITLIADVFFLSWFLYCKDILSLGMFLMSSCAYLSSLSRYNFDKINERITNLEQLIKKETKQ